MLKVEKIEQTLLLHEAANKILNYLENDMRVSPVALFDIRTHFDVLFLDSANEIVIDFNMGGSLRFTYKDNFRDDHDALDDLCVWLLSCHMVRSNSISWRIL